MKVIYDKNYYSIGTRLYLFKIYINNKEFHRCFQKA